jgi:hypothetical protein
VLLLRAYRLAKLVPLGHMRVVLGFQRVDCRSRQVVEEVLHKREQMVSQRAGCKQAMPAQWVVDMWAEMVSQLVHCYKRATLALLGADTRLEKVFPQEVGTHRLEMVEVGRMREEAHKSRRAEQHKRKMSLLLDYNKQEELGLHRQDSSLPESGCKQLEEMEEGYTQDRLVSKKAESIRLCSATAYTLDRRLLV